MEIEELITCGLLSQGDTFYFKDYSVQINDKNQLEWKIDKRRYTSNKPSEFLAMVLKNVALEDGESNVDVWKSLVDSNGSSLDLYRAQYYDMMGKEYEYDSDDTIVVQSGKRKRRARKEETETKRQKTSSNGSSTTSSAPSDNYQKQITRLLYKNSALSKVDLSKIFNLQSYNLLSDDEKKELSQYLPDVDVDQNGIAIPFTFKNQFFRESMDQLQSLITEGWMNPNKNLREIIEGNQKKNSRKGTREHGVETFWFDKLDQMDMSWVKDL